MSSDCDLQLLKIITIESHGKLWGVCGAKRGFGSTLFFSSFLFRNSLKAEKGQEAGIRAYLFRFEEYG